MTEAKVKTYVRPIIVLALLGAVVAAPFTNVALPDWMVWAFMGTAAEYFGERAFKRARES